MASKKKSSPVKAKAAAIKAVKSTSPAKKVSVMSKVKSAISSPTAKKVATVAAIGAGVVGAAVVGKKLVQMYRKKKRNTVQKLRSKIKRTTLMLQLIKLKRKLERAQMRGM